MLKSGLATMSLVAAKTTIPIDPNRPPHRPRPRKSGRFTLHAHRAHSRATSARHLAPLSNTKCPSYHQVTGILTDRSILTNETLILDGERNLAVGPLEACYKSMICPFDDAEAYPASYMPSEAENSHKPILQFLFRHICHHPAVPPHIREPLHAKPTLLATSHTRS